MSTDKHSPRGTQERAKIADAIDEAEMAGPDAVFEVSEELEYEAYNTAERLAALDFLLTGTACYGLTWPDRFDRIRKLQEAAAK